MRLAVVFTKEAPVRFVSHLDLQRLFQRAFRRAKLPLAYSQGFNPHPLVAFATALSVGFTSEGEYLDLTLTEDVSPVSKDKNHYYTWMMCGENEHSTIVHMNNGYHPGDETPTQPVETAETAEPTTEAPVSVVRMPVGGDSAFPMLPYPMPDSVGADGQTHASQTNSVSGAITWVKGRRNFRAR